MKKSERVLMTIVAVIVLLAAVQMTFLLLTERTRSRQLAQVKMPKSIAAYDKLIRESGGEPVESGPEKPADETESPPVLPEDALDIIAGYNSLFAHIDMIRKSEGENMPPYDDPEKWTDDELARLAEFLMGHQDLIEEIRRIAERGGPAYQLDFSKGFDMLLPHLGQIHECARLLRADAVVKARAGNYDEAIEDIIAGMKIADAIGHEPILISQLVRIASYGIMDDAIKRSFTGGDLSAQQMSKLLGYMDQADNRTAFADSFGGEQAMGGQTFSDTGQLRKLLGREVFTDIDIVPFTNDSRKFQAWLYTSPLGRPWLNMDESAHSDILSRAEAAAELPHYEAQPLFEQIDEDVANLPRTRVLTRSMTPTLLRANEAQARHEATLDLTQMGMLLEQYEAQHGYYPETLDAIATRLGGTVPVDPFTGSAYRYDPSGDGFQLYSLGPNQTDDNGIHDERTADIVWRGQKQSE